MQSTLVMQPSKMTYTGYAGQCHYGFVSVDMPYTV